MSSTSEQQQLQDKIAQALELARAAGATAEVGVYQDQGLVVSVRQGKVDKVEFTRNHGFSVTVYLGQGQGQRKGHASSTDFSAAAIVQAVQAALDIARYTAEDPCSGLAEAERMARTIPDLHLNHPWHLQPDQAIDMARRCEAAGLGAHPAISNSDGATVASVESMRGYGNSHGLVVVYPQTRHAVSCALIASRGEQMERGGWSFSRRNPAALPAVESIGARAAERASRRLGSRTVPTCDVPVLFAAEIAGGLLGHCITAISGGNLYRHSSFLEGALGTRIFPQWLTISEHPLLPGEVGSAPVDGDGLPTAEQCFVQQGELVRYVLGTYSARKLGLHSTANAGGVRNLRCTSTHTLGALLQQMQRGLLVTDLMGQGVNIVSGDYSRGAAGFWVENGAIQFPVSEVTIAGNLKNMFANMVGVADDVDPRGNIQCGSILLETMKVGGK
jgi:PmbA protein